MIQSVHIIIPCYNEAERLPGEGLLAFLEAHPWASLSLVNDGSADETLALLEHLKESAPERIDVHNLPENVGKAEAVRQGILQSLHRPCDFFAYLDADLSTPPEAFADMLKASKPQHKFILGARVLRAGAVIERSPRRHYLGRMFATAASTALSLRFYDTQCGAKLIARQLIEPLFADPFLSRWLFDLELLMRLRGLLGEEEFRNTVLEVPLSRWIDTGNSRIRARDLALVPYELLLIRSRYRR
jgi:dolichyl-phosphate beta-glucosyltransferase